jgi:DNA-binding response OmpR family regulator
MKILIAEDDKHSGVLYQEIFKEDEVVIAKDGEAFLSLYNDSFDYLIVDIRLPIKDGFAVVYELERMNNQIPIIVVTAIGADEVKRRLGERCLVIEKPISTKHFSNQIKAL